MTTATTATTPKNTTPTYSNHLSVHQWIRSAIRDSQQLTSPISSLFLKLPPPPCAVLLAYIYIFISIYRSIDRSIDRSIYLSIYLSIYIEIKTKTRLFFRKVKVVAPTLRGCSNFPSKAIFKYCRWSPSMAQKPSGLSTSMAQVQPGCCVPCLQCCWIY